MEDIKYWPEETAEGLHDLLSFWRLTSIELEEYFSKEFSPFLFKAFKAHHTMGKY